MRARSKLVYTCAFVLGAGMLSANTAQAASLFDFWRSDPAINQVDDLSDYGADPTRSTTTQVQAQDSAPQHQTPVLVTAAPVSVDAPQAQESEHRHLWLSNAQVHDDGLGDYNEDYRADPAQPDALATLPAEMRVTPEDLRAFMRNEVREEQQRQAQQYDWSDSAGDDDLGDYSEDYRS